MASESSGTPSGHRSGEGEALTKWGWRQSGGPWESGSHAEEDPREAGNTAQTAAACEFREADVQKWADRELEFCPSARTPQELSE